MIPQTAGRTLLENVLSYFDDDRRFFAFRLGRDLWDSSLTFGQLDPSIANDSGGFAYTRVYQGLQSAPDYWKLPLRAISLDGNITFSDFAQPRVPGSPTPIAVFDSGTTFILGPSADVAAFWEIVGGARKGNELWQIKCNRAVLVGFVLGDAGATGEYTVDPADVSWRADDEGDGWCTGGIQESNSVNSGDWIPGTTFLRVCMSWAHSARVLPHPRSLACSIL